MRKEAAVRASILTPVLVFVLLLALAPVGLAQDDLNCDDFSSQKEAQAELDADPSDPHGLDADNDEEACEDHDYPESEPEDEAQPESEPEDEAQDEDESDAAAPTGGVDTGAGGTASTGALTQGIFAAGGALALGGVAAIRLRGRRT